MLHIGLGLDLLLVVARRQRRVEQLVRVLPGARRLVLRQIEKRARAYFLGHAQLVVLVATAAALALLLELLHALQVLLLLLERELLVVVAVRAALLLPRGAFVRELDAALLLALVRRPSSPAVLC